MWPDNETERDFLNFSGVADTVAEIIVQARGRPISIGVSGAWGIGKSSMIKLAQTSLARRRHQGPRELPPLVSPRRAPQKSDRQRMSQRRHDPRNTEAPYVIRLEPLDNLPRPSHRQPREVL
jgi:hypothetical protein